MKFFDDLEKGPNENRVKEIGLARGYLQPTSFANEGKIPRFGTKKTRPLSA